ncbi:C6 zinc finger domain protein [Aspergillus sclerotiicarbonarius CBS 121057]|uniref:C6 zinc finger domain protein n=1 Tax=Aspergillus sclerotiicarbonarius (strain CBS 121057 / IBT 28362) TaxID=1448318 RepID=A0A319EMJ3_ASPSB|nr:C6 zinc finger domain protein [Aspergillus sclerotiicarbonarius CBS 121057]
MEPHQKKRRASKPKAKTGCRTCKIRRVKCDEGRPACRRCVSTGRVCDGYGIWGGGGNTSSGNRATIPKVCQNALSCYNAPVPIVHAASSERICVDWFIQRTISKIGGVFSSEFWNRLVVQAISQEPAVRHAALALASTHRYGAHKGDQACTMEDHLREYERFTLQHYNQAISCLHTEFRRNTRLNQTMMVALITCMLFVTLEMLRGQYAASQTHLQHGLRLLKEIQRLSGTSRNGRLLIRTLSRTVEDDIIQVFSRLAVQSALLGHGTQHSNLDYEIQPHHLPYKFQSIEQARQYLDVLLARTQSLVEMGRQIETDMYVEPQSYEGLLESQWRMEKELTIWLDVYKLSLGEFGSHDLSQSILAEKLLTMYHTMALIMVTTCIPWDDETAFDLQTDRFLSIIHEAIRICQAIKDVYPDSFSGGTPLGCPLGMAFTMDIGFIQPLYYTALKCRVPRIRRHAIKLLRLAPHREGIWNGTRTAKIAEEVIANEERNIDGGLSYENSFDILSLPQVGDSISVLPYLCRISDVRVELPNETTGEVTVSFWQIEDGSSWKLCEKVFPREDS